MVLGGSVRGYAEIRHLQALLGGCPADLRDDLAKGVRSALAPLKREIPDAAVSHMPQRHGYGALLARSTKVTTRVTTGDDITATVKVVARGRNKERDVRTINAGRLRHPVWGNREVWRVTRVRAGFVNEPVEDARLRVVRNSEQARDKLANKLLRE